MSSNVHSVGCKMVQTTIKLMLLLYSAKIVYCFCPRVPSLGGIPARIVNKELECALLVSFNSATTEQLRELNHFFSVKQGMIVIPINSRNLKTFRKVQMLIPVIVLWRLLLIEIFLLKRS